MSKKFFILLEEFSKKPTAEIGQLSKSIAKLVDAGIAVPKAACIPQSTLKLIAQANDLEKKVGELIKKTDFQNHLSKNKTIKKIKFLINKQKIPLDLSKEFLELYHKYFESSFVSIQNSYSTENNIMIQNIEGDVNVVDVFFEVWSKLTQQVFENNSSKTQDIEKLLFPEPILIKQQINSERSGIALTFDELDGDKKRLTIKGVWGVNNTSDNKKSLADTYITDSRTFNLIKKTTKNQKYQFIRNVDHLKEQKLGITKQNKDVLSSEQVAQLAKIITKIKKLYIYQLKISWELQNNVFFISDVKEAVYFNDLKKQITKNSKHLKKVYVSVTKNKDSEIIKKYADGLSILNSGELLSSLKEHPMHVAKTAKKKILVAAISETIEKYIAIKKDLHLTYRFQNLTSKELLKLKYSRNHESQESNPYLGLRGSSKIIGQPQILNLELEIIKKLLKKTKNNISLVIPFARSSDEVLQVIKQIDKSGITVAPNIDIWLELSTPENALNLSKYPLNKIGGVIFNIKNIYDLMIGVDPNDVEMISKHQKDFQFIIELIKNVARELNSSSKKQSLIKKKELLIDLTNFDAGIIKDVINEDISGIIVNPQVTAITKKCIIDGESKNLYGNN